MKARLLSYNNAPVWQIGNEIVTGMHADHIRFPELPGNLYSRPTLIWTLENGGAARHRVEASYLAGKLSWNADYVLTVGARRQGRRPRRLGHAHQRQRHGVPQREAAARRRRSQSRAPGVRPDGRCDAKLRRRIAAAAPMAQEAFSDYHLYTLGRKTTINNNETKQVSMLDATGFPVRKRYVVDGQAFYYRNAQHPGAPIKDVGAGVLPVQERGAAPGSGMPMPAGTVRVYQADSKGGMQFVGEDRIDHTPKDETLNLKIGNAFDVVARAQADRLPEDRRRTSTRSSTRSRCATTRRRRSPSR